MSVNSNTAHAPQAPFWSNSPVCWPFRWSNAQPARWLVLQKASNPPAMIKKFSPASNRSFKCKYPTKHNRNILRTVVCKYREFAVKTEISNYFIFSREKPFGETFSKITINQFPKNFHFRENRQKVKCGPTPYGRRSKTF